MESAPHSDHGNTPAAWTAVVVMLLGMTIGAVAVILLNWTLFWIGGVGVLVLGVVVGKVMSMMGFGKTVSYTQPAAEDAAEGETAPDTPRPHAR
jgi:hypothetical protein